MLSIVATPIGNLGDITLRAIETLKACDAVVCEDTRVTGNLLKQLDIPKKELISLHGYSHPQVVHRLLARLADGEHLALVSDAGTPGISDPGYVLVAKAAEAELRIESVPGPSAVIAAASISGLPIHHFLYLGFLPLKKGRKTLINSFIQEERTILFYESVHRIERTLLELAAALASQPERQVVIARELTKMHEEVIRTTVAQLPVIAKSITRKGEFVVIVGALG
ncbi:MAG: 16S rRNA (cytidine1402-2'-O)-methyltransferase [Candidatus Peregrinibacteria bacterium Gr01-1014_25]|nr:MAG: 16S rRNA (cytidine1402-2'-O)-methyltransferase [Candidatus Peregrinibacteria bacterium Gr01-1014_25]